MQIIQETNPADDDYHTWIRSAEEIKTFRESIEDPEWAEYDEYNPDFTRAMAGGGPGERRDRGVQFLPH